ncbi:MULTISPECIES: hypothetical protein [Paenibacillus]|uniref:hypothetical protein n=1 Tax=Paenibacillus TaxID=44249 RepID=UPI0003858D4D|nr:MULTISPECIES: hypothetical protein [Paenibacillus]EPY12723.1 hypothetical protein PAAL66ix_11893 [Paenibacillus alvei A6-6i-x]
MAKQELVVMEELKEELPEEEGKRKPEEWLINAVTTLLGKVFADERGWRNPETKESLVRFLLTLNKGMEMAASKIPQDVRVANRKLSKALDFYSSIDRWDLPNRFRVQDIDPVLFDHQIIDIKQYNAWEDPHLTPQQKNEIAKLIYERFKDDTDIATQNYFFVVEHTSEGIDVLAGAIGSRKGKGFVCDHNPQLHRKPQGISKGIIVFGLRTSMMHLCWGLCPSGEKMTFKVKCENREAC